MLTRRLVYFLIGLCLSMGSKANTLILVPASPGSLPLLAADSLLPETQVSVFINHSQAHARFIHQADVLILTGLSVGKRLYEQGVPIRILASLVSGLTWWVGVDITIQRIQQLKNQTIYVPFSDSPIEEVARFLIEKQGLVYGKDVKVKYSPLPATAELLKQKKALIAALPEPFISQLADIPYLYIGNSFDSLWNKATGATQGYPQLCLFALSRWTETHPDEIAALLNMANQQIQSIQHDTLAGLRMLQSNKFPIPFPHASEILGRVQFQLLTGQALKTHIETYYQTLGIPLEKAFQDFFYIHP